MTLTELLTALRAADIELSVREGKLVCAAPKNAMTAELAAAIREHKPALVDLVAQVQSESDPAAAGADKIRRLNREERRPLTTAQESLVFRQRLEPDSAFLNLPGAWHLRGELDVERLKAALHGFYRRHDILGATIKTDEKGCYFDFSGPQNLDIGSQDFTAIGEKTRDEHLIRYLEQHSKDPIDLEYGPLFRCEIVHVGDDHHVLFILVHHIVWDGWSFDIFLEELDTIYRAHGNTDASGLEADTVSYTDYAQWHRERTSSESMQARIQGVAAELSDYAKHFELPTDHSRPAEFGYDGSTEYFELSGNIADAIEAICTKTRATPYMVLFAVFHLVLARYSGQRDIAIGSHIQNRTRTELDNLVGFFVNTMVIRVQQRDEWSFRDFLTAVRDRCLQAYENRHVPIDSLVRELRIAPDPGSLPLVQVFFSFQDTSHRTSSIGDVACQSVIRSAQTTDADLTLWVRNYGDRLDGGFDYRTDLYSASTIRSLKSSFVHVLEALARHMDVALADVPLLADSAAAELIDAWSGPRQDNPATSVYQLVETQVQRVPDRSAATFDDYTLSYRQLQSRVSAACVFLDAEGVEPGTVVGVHIERSESMLVTLLALLRLGATYVPLDPALPADRLGFICGDSAARFVIIDSEDPPQWVPDGVRALGVPDSQFGDAAFDGPYPQPGDPAYMIYTSGSTGKPKGVVVSHGNVVNFLRSMAELPGMVETDRLLAVTTCSFDISVLELFLPLAVGAEVVIASNDQSRDGNVLASMLEELDISVFQSTPATWRMLLAAGWQGNEHLKALCGGEALPAELARELRPRVSQLFNMYGPTETTVWSAVHECGPETDYKVPLGRPILNTQLHILDAGQRPAPAGAIGELYIGGDGVSLGYHDREMLTSDKFVESPFFEGERMYATGDLVRIGGTGNLYFEGRMDGQIKVRGYRIELGEIENAFHKLDAVEQAAVVLRQLSADDHRLFAFVVPAAGQPLTMNVLRKHLRKLLPDYMIPQHISEIQKLPLTPSGKVDRKALPDVDLSTRKRTTEPPRTQAEVAIAEIWKQAIGVDAIDRRDHFFDLGGHSLLAIQVIAEIERHLGKKISAGAIMLDNLQQIAAGLGVEEPAAVDLPAAATPGSNKKGVIETIRVWMGQ